MSETNLEREVMLDVELDGSGLLTEISSIKVLVSRYLEKEV